MMTKGIVVAGLSGGSGKSIVSVGLTAGLRKKGYGVVPFKKGPDYIDAGWMALAAGGECYNLDPYLMSEGAIHRSVADHADGADFIVVEGNRGLYDGVNATGGYSTAELAKLLDIPILLVVDCTKTTRTVAAMVLGCKMLDPQITIGGVVLNQIATQRQRKIITEAIEQETSIPVLGAVPRMKKDIFPMRHLGMIPHQEYRDSFDAVDFLGSTIDDALDMERVLQVMTTVEFKTALKDTSEGIGWNDKKVRLGVIQDAAFQFYYAENLEALQAAGAELIRINALDDSILPEIDGLYIGGGFPETSAPQLAENHSFRESVLEAAKSGMPIYAECGGLIYLGESITLDDKTFPLCGVFPVKFGMSSKPQAHGYSIFTVDMDNPYYPKMTKVKGHEFRYSTVLEWRGQEADLVFKMERGTGFAHGRDGLMYQNVVALYTHIHATGTGGWAEQFVRVCREWKGDS